MNRIDETFQVLKEQGRAALMPYLPLGYPTLALSRDLISEAQEAGADILELGVPFSDPLADGPVVQHATQVALENGMNLEKCLGLVQDARTHSVTIPLLFMGYYNPLLHYGLERFARDAFEVGVDGVIVPDVPMEEAEPLQKALRTQDMHLVLLAAPTTDDARLKKIGKATRGFLYLVSLTGTTGARGTLPEGLEQLVERARAATDKPICVGFGISSPENAHRVAEMADGVIVGSALVAKIGDPDTAIANEREFIGALSQAVQH